MPDTTVLVLGTCDTKLQELLFLKDRIQAHSPVRAILLDVGRDAVQHDQIDIPRANLIAGDPEDKDVSRLPRGEVIKYMASCAGRTVKELYQKDEIHGIVSAGGSGGKDPTQTSMSPMSLKIRRITVVYVPLRAVWNQTGTGYPGSVQKALGSISISVAADRVLLKMIISTVASGDTGPIVGETDISMVYSVVDVAGLNQVLREILGNAGAAIGAMAQAFSYRRSKDGDGNSSSAADTPAQKRVGITMFGVTTPGVDAIRSHLESNYNIEVYVFHATGHGGKAMERLVRQGMLDAVLDLTTTEICDLVTGGVMSADPDRLEAAAQAGIPYIVSVGASDMSNFGPKNTVPEAYRNRRLYEHNPVVTLMRSSPDECRQVGQFIVEKLKGAPTPASVQVWLPLGGVSMIATPGGPFADEEADDVLFSTIKQGLDGSGIEVIEDQRDINDEGFAKDIAEALARLMGIQR